MLTVTNSRMENSPVISVVKSPVINVLLLQLIMEKNLKLEQWIDNFNNMRPFVADEIAIFILSKLLGYGIAIILQNHLWTTTQGDDMMGCDVYFAYCGEGNFVPLKHYDPDQEDELLKKYCPEKSKEKKKKGGGGEGREREKGSRFVH